jgi:hypothetical protein
LRLTHTACSVVAHSQPEFGIASQGFGYRSGRNWCGVIL